MLLGKIHLSALCFTDNQTKDTEIRCGVDRIMTLINNYNINVKSISY